MIHDVPDSPGAHEEEDRYWMSVTKLVTFACLMGVIAIVVVSALAGCNPAASAADADYLARQLACVDQASTKEQATACRNAVKAEWAAAATDGGAR